MWKQFFELNCWNGSWKEKSLNTVAANIIQKINLIFIFYTFCGNMNTKFFCQRNCVFNQTVSAKISNVINQTFVQFERFNVHDVERCQRRITRTKIIHVNRKSFFEKLISNLFDFIICDCSSFCDFDWHKLPVQIDFLRNACILLNYIFIIKTCTWKIYWNRDNILAFRKPFFLLIADISENIFIQNPNHSILLKNWNKTSRIHYCSVAFLPAD